MSSNIKVVAAIIYNEENQYLMARKKAGKTFAGFWEFPGGKVENGEDALEAIKREIKEELNLELIDINFGFEYPYQEKDQLINFIFFRAKIASGKIVLSDHDAIVWMNGHETNHYKIAPGDLEAVRRINAEG